GTATFTMSSSTVYVGLAVCSRSTSILDTATFDNVMVPGWVYSPGLAMTPTGANLTLSWPATSLGFTLQSCTNLAESNWVNVTSPAPQIGGDRWQIDVSGMNAGGCGVFFRLLK
ncbi:MAG TPA: hypothetical protein VK327_04135, partial [Candidatus Paceibacterota bacterium]|nr:hypothetical protein [Candidatus Paceibacterota bacterium]